MSNLQDFIRIRYEYPVEGYLMVDNESQVRLQLRKDVPRFYIQIRGFINIVTWQMIRGERQRNQEEQIDIEESDFFLELFGLRPYESDPEPEDWNCKYHKFILYI
ncbi:PREDICTED: uncharacterized protein LOC105153699 isoform X2 [Acromyrmex echinatior]|uniref:uncharacterized protein LOC105153699 isoform X2 n=1 Tax=Acromyrmex echinatior TaxID=103372 RepID=UPI000580F30C|nr:PREDICTED: uncharacterized protein LOC105153699 isoform X2 [Acromyrmex echinatior]